MALNKTLLKGKISPLDIRNIDGQYKESDVRGISTQKEFIETKADLTGVNLNSYKIVPPKCFAYVPDTSRRGDKIALAYNDTNQAYLISSIYTVFQVNENSGLDADYLGMFFNRESFDRYARFHSWGTAREVFDWAELEQTSITLPDIKIQRKYSAIYRAIQENQRNYEQGLEDLKLVCDSTIEDIRRHIPCEPIGPHIQEYDNRNNLNLSKDAVRGISTDKKLIPTIAKLDNVNIDNYKIVQPGQIAYVPDTSRRGDKISLGQNTSDEPLLVSSIYTVFTTNNDKLLAEYLMLFFARQEFDRYARFHSWGTARETFDWNDMCQVKIPIPDINTQTSIANIYKAYLKRQKINERLKTNLKSLCPILIRGAITEAEAKA